MAKLTREQFIKYLEYHGACPPAMKWVRKTKGGPLSLVKKCPRLDWITFLAVCAFPGEALNEGCRVWSRVDGYLDYVVANEVEGQFYKAWALDNWPEVEANILKSCSLLW